MCARWRGGEGFHNFLADVGKRPGDHYTLERRNNDRGYEPGNVVWATRADQARNKSCNKLTLDDARIIRSMAASGSGQRAIARHFGIAHSGVVRIVNGQLWREA